MSTEQRKTATEIVAEMGERQFSESEVRKLLKTIMRSYRGMSPVFKDEIGKKECYDIQPVKFNMHSCLMGRLFTLIDSLFEGQRAKATKDIMRDIIDDALLGIERETLWNAQDFLGLDQFNDGIVK